MQKPDILLLDEATSALDPRRPPTSTSPWPSACPRRPSFRCCTPTPSRPTPFGRPFYNRTLDVGPRSPWSRGLDEAAVAAAETPRPPPCGEGPVARGSATAGRDRSTRRSGRERAMPRRTTADLDDDALLDLVQRQTLRYFWDFAHPVCGAGPRAEQRHPAIRPRGGDDRRQRLRRHGDHRRGRRAGGSPAPRRSTGCGRWCASSSRPTATTASGRTS